MGLDINGNDTEILQFEALEMLAKRGRLFAIVDAVCHNDIAGFAAELLADNQAAAIPQLEQSEYLSDDTVPYLVRISPRFWRFLSSEVWKRSDEEAPPSWGLFLELGDFDEKKSANAFNRGLRHWRNWYRIELPPTGTLVQTVDPEAQEKSNISAIFRFFDPRLTDAFVEVSNEIERSAFFGPVRRLLLPQAGGRVKILYAPQNSVSANQKEICVTESRPFLIRPEHLAALELRRLECRLPVFQQYLEKHFEEEFQGLQIEDRQAFILQGLREATNYHCLSERSALGWLTLQLLHGPNFIKDKAWALRILNDKRHTIGGEDRAARLIKMGFEQARLQEQTGMQA